MKLSVSSRTGMCEMEENNATRHYLGNNVAYFHLLLRLVGDEERRWTDENIDMVALKHFPNIDKDKALNRPILYSNWLSKV